MPDTLFLLALIVSLGVFVSTGASAAEKKGEYLFSKAGLTDESLFSKAGFSRLAGGDLKLVPVGNHGAGLHMTAKSPSRLENAVYVSKADNNNGKIDHGVYLSVKMPW
jgi:hypothetical protein